MGNSVSRVVSCFVPVAAHDRDRVAVFFSEPLDEGLGHSFCYVRPDSPHLSPSHSERYNTLTGLHHDSDYHSSSFRSGNTETAAFKAISGASVSANTSTPRTIVCHEQFHSFKVPDDRHAAFESTPSFTSIPLQPVPRGVSLSGPVSGAFSGPISGSALQDRGYMMGLDEQQPRGFISGPLERAFMSGPLERGFMSGPLERSSMSGPIENSGADRTHFSAPLAGAYHFRRNRRISKISRFLSSVRKPVKGALNRTISTTLARTRRSLVAPVRQFVWRHLHSGTKESTVIYDTPSELRYASSDADPIENQKLQWAQGKAGEDRVHVVISEEHGWLFVGIYDGFNGPDAPDFLMRNLYRAVYKELQGLLWDAKDRPSETKLEDDNGPHHHANVYSSHNGLPNLDLGAHECEARSGKLIITGGTLSDSGRIRVNKDGVLVRSRTLKELLDSDNFTSSADEHEECMLSHKTLQREKTDIGSANVQLERLSCNHTTDERSLSNCQAESVVIQSSSKNESCTEEAPRQVIKDSTNTEISKKRQERVLTTWIPNFLHRQIKNKENHRNFLPERCDSLTEMKESVKESNQGEPKLWKQGTVDHAAVLGALARALETTEQAYLDMADQALEENPELALMGSCILVALMKDKDVYILNVGDSRAIVAQERKNEYLCTKDGTKRCGGKDLMNKPDLERISEESPAAEVSGISAVPQTNSLYALQLSTDHSTSIEEEVSRIKAEHPDDNTCILNDRVKGRLKVTRAFGAGFLKKPRWNSAILKMFQIDYIGTVPYVTCTPSLHHHRLGPDDRFLILSSDGLYQYFSNQEVVSQVEWFMEKFPEGDPAQHLIEELLFRAAKKAGMDFHDLLDIPQGDRRKYHDDVSVMVISIDGRIWRSSG